MTDLNKRVPKNHSDIKVGMKVITSRRDSSEYGIVMIVDLKDWYPYTVGYSKGTEYCMFEDILCILEE